MKMIAKGGKAWLKGLAAVLAIATMVVATAQEVPAAGALPQRVMEAIDKYRAGDVGAAISALETLHQEDPENADVCAWLGFLYLRNQEPAKAIPVLEKGASLREGDLEVLVNLGNAYLQVDRPDDAAAKYREVIQLDPQRHEAWYNLGGIHLTKKEYPRAADAYRRAIAIKADDAFSHNNLGAALEGMNEFQLAAEHYVRAAELRPDSVVFHRNAGFALLRLRKDAEALPYLEMAAQGPDPEPELLTALVEIYGRLNRGEDALALMSRFEPKLGTTATYWYNRGVLEAKVGKTGEAEASYRKALEIEPDDLDALNNLGLILFEKGDFEGARVCFEKLMGLNPSSRNTRLNYASALARLGELEPAIDIWKDIVRQEPSRFDVRLELANALWETGDRAGARFHYAYTLREQPTNVVALNGLGLWNLAESNLDEAARLFRSAINANSRYMPPYNNLAVTLERQNKRAEAIQILERALQLQPDYEDARRNLDRMKATG